MMQGILEDSAALELGAVDTNQLLTLLECPVCLDHITPPIKQCIKGHLVCSDCFPRLPHCPTCRSTMSAERNLGMEQVSRLLNFPCRYHPMGCKVSATLTLKAEHELKCEYMHLKCPFHGQCSFSGAFASVVPHLKSEHSVTPVPIQPNGNLFYRAKQFYKRNLWNFIFDWDKNIFRLMVKSVHASSVGKTDNCNLIIGHVQYVGPESMASQYAYEIRFFHADYHRQGPKFEGVVSSTMKPLESLVAKNEVFVANAYTAREFTDQYGQLCFTVTMRSLKEKEGKAEPRDRSRSPRSTSRRRRTPTRAPAAAPAVAAPVSAPVAAPAPSASTAPVAAGQPTVPSTPSTSSASTSSSSSVPSGAAPANPATSSGSTQSTTTTTDSANTRTETNNATVEEPQAAP